MTSCLAIGLTFTLGDTADPFGIRTPSALELASQPSPLEIEEERLPVVERLARQFNPAMALPNDDVWPVDVRYAWSEGADLVGEALGPRGKVENRFVAVPNALLETRPWADLPERDRRGRKIRYTMDLPGDDEDDRGLSRWRRRFRALTGNEDSNQILSRKRFPPTQYAHLFWFNRDQGLLGIQYWFFYPFNEWVNRHEGDWEHINVILKGSKTLTEELGPQSFHPVGYQFFFHNSRYDTRDVFRTKGKGTGGDHVVVFGGGRGRFLFWSGNQSGASYPMPAVYARAAEAIVGTDEDTRRPKRFIAADQFRVVVLPEPDRLDAHAHPHLSWLKIDFYAGQEKVSTNPFIIDWLGKGGPVSQPARRDAWNGTINKPAWRGRPRLARWGMPHWPVGWSILTGPLTTIPRSS